MRSDDDATAADIVGDPNWFVENYDPHRATFSFVRAGRDVLASQPFLDYRWRRETLERREVPLDAMAARMPQQAPRPQLHFIWHTSFCCSTLVAEALDLAGRNLSLREPLVLVSAADAKRTSARMNRPIPPRLIELVFRLLGRPATRDEWVTVKPSNFANTLIEDAASQSRGKALFLHSGLEDFLISMEKGGDPLRKYARRLFGNIAGDSGAALPIPPQEIFHLSDLEIAALAWHMQIAHFQRSARLLGPGRLASLDGKFFLADPAAALAALDDFFALELGREHISRVAAGQLLKRHAKQPGYPFDAEQRQTQADSVRRRLGANLQRIIEWSYRTCPATPRNMPLFPGALMA